MYNSNPVYFGRTSSFQNLDNLLDQYFHHLPDVTSPDRQTQFCVLDAEVHTASLRIDGPGAVSATRASVQRPVTVRARPC